ncbi:MAG: GGDEF domain-containing protein [Treponema sp.]|nr:GGDEF domain-containing protein [Treponema sp.]
MKKKIAVLICGWSTYFIKDFIAGMSRAIKDNNIDLYIFNAYNYTEYSGFLNYTGFSIFSLIHYEDFDGVIILSDLIENIRILEKERQKILKAGIPAIAINKALNGLSCIRVDNYTGLYEMMEHLIKNHGITDFGFISGKETSVDIAERYKAYRTALTDNQIKIEINQTYSIKACDYHSAYNFFSEKVKSGEHIPQAIVCANDLIALAVEKVASENGIKIPEQLKVIGYDDCSFASCVNPGLSTVKNNIEQVGFEAVNRVLNGDSETHHFKIKSKPVFRESCGCTAQNEANKDKTLLNFLDEGQKKEEFDTHMELLSEIFMEAVDVFTLLTNIEAYIAKSHTFEGSDFCIFMKSDWTSVLINSAEKLPQNLSYGEQVQSICSIQGGIKYPREMISTRELIPSKMKTDESNIFLFIPIFNHSYVHGYFVCKNNLSMIENHYGYVWTRTMGTSIEHFRKKNMYKQMSNEYQRLSTRDALSGMLNRAGFERLVKPFYAQNKKNGLTTVIFFVDINKMKTINDNFGHLHGDLAVKTVSASVLEVVPKNWMCVRYGGDEFLVVGNSRNYNGEDYCQKIKERLAAKTAVMKLPYLLSASVGSYTVPANSELTLEQAVENADSSMYYQKQSFHKAN